MERICNSTCSQVRRATTRVSKASEEPVVRVTANAPSIAAAPAYTIDALPKAPAAMAVAAPRTEAAQTSGDVSPRAVRIVTATAAITDRAYVRTAGFISRSEERRVGTECR